MISIDIGLLLLIFTGIFSIVFWCFYREEPNYVFGFRTKRSTASVSNWRFAQQWFSLLAMLFLGGVVLLQRNELIAEAFYQVAVFGSYLLAALLVETALYLKDSRTSTKK
ncbi:SdpI family protein [Enterococcus casseliflavus]|uniref:SdpI family protein n=1 Tax=Enterococcus casseliflavus TaxID=37734 RepID=UPI00201CD5CB|nr:SdpI family protein [Enterococcus casseliflavus]MDT2989628.1 SdpI family protein [Enterococcus casseliflavus]MDV7689339.1 SdpI family protein [Enterococcus casseliflavus]MDV7712762.1 SdpI family protein [Enterococcus casseliflavus]MDV7737043.1 SdpI family protein [Enterococcus casseliflavus]UQZ98639.1 SdpI family protein [Enterococcus casseliflavus]